MEPTDITIQILRDIRSELRGVSERLESLERGVSERLESLERHAVATHEAIGVLTEQVTFYGRSATAAAEARLRQDERIDRLEQRVGALENRDHG